MYRIRRNSPLQHMKLLCHIGVHRGLGHLQRQATILRSVRALAPEMQILVHLSAPDTHVLRRGEFEIAIGDPRTDLPRVLREMEPDAVLFDTFLPEERPTGLPRNPAVILTLRKMRPRRLPALLRSPWMEWTRLVVLPHLLDEFSLTLPDQYDAEVVNAGPIVRPVLSSPEAGSDHAGLLHHGRRADPLIVAASGGGGLPEFYARFRDASLGGFAAARAAIPDLRMIFVSGPQNPPLDPVPDGVESIEFTPDLPELFARARLVIGHAGYNSTMEILHARAPVLFLPIATKYDDGHARAEWWTRAGVGQSIDSFDANAVGRFLSDYFADPKKETAMRAAYERISLPVGNEIAARAIVRCIVERRADVAAIQAPLIPHARASSPLKSDGPLAQKECSPSPDLANRGVTNCASKRESVLPRLASGLCPSGADTLPQALKIEFHVPVLAYRRIGAHTAEPGTTSLNRFLEQIDWLSRNATPATVESALTALDSGGPPAEGSVLVTFDDGYADLLDAALPALEERGMRALIFLPTRYAGRWDKWNTKSTAQSRHLSWDECRELLSRGHEIGVAARSHHALVKFDREEAKSELLGARREAMEALTLASRSTQTRSRSSDEPDVPEVRCVAYPHGALDRQVARLASKGYRLGFGWTEGTETDWRAAPHAIRRLRVMPYWDLADFVGSVRRTAESDRRSCGSARVHHEINR